MTTLGRPTPGKRPANRRHLIRAAAAELFAARGYEHVSMGDIANAVAVGPSALYRHFSSKADLLAFVIDEIVTTTSEMVNDHDSSRTQVLRLAEYAADHRQAGVLWQRESRHLTPETVASLRNRLRIIRDRLATAISREQSNMDIAQARVHATGALAVIFSPAFHRAELDRLDFIELLAAIAERVLRSDTPAAPARPPARPTGLIRASRREQVITAAMHLFAERTYASVGMEEIAAEANMAISTVYQQFPSKVDILATALQRGTGYLQITLDWALNSATDQRDALGKLVDDYTRFALQHPEMIDALITELRSLDPTSAHNATIAQREYIAEWIHLYRHEHPAADLATATIIVQAALMIINDLARSPTFRTRSDAATVAAILVNAALGLS